MAVVYQYLRLLLNPLAVSNGKRLHVEMDIVTTVIPALLGMDILGCESMAPCTVSNTLIMRISNKMEAGACNSLDQWSYNVFMGAIYCTTNGPYH